MSTSIEHCYYEITKAHDNGHASNKHTLNTSLVKYCTQLFALDKLISMLNVMYASVINRFCRWPYEMFVMFGEKMGERWGRR